MKQTLKICKVRDPQNIAELCTLRPKYIGFDFRPSSQHYIGEIDEALLSIVPESVRKVGVFDSDSALYISYIAGRFSLVGVQLEGNVPPQTCEMLAAEGLEVIKVLNSLDEVEKYEGVCNRFLVRNKGVMDGYTGKTPLMVDFSLVGDTTPQGVVVDISTHFEDRVAYKNCEKIENWRKDRF